MRLLEPLPADAEVELTTLLTFLHRARGFAVALAEVNAPTYERELIHEAEARLGDRSVAVVDISSIGIEPGLGTRLIEASKDRDVVFLTGLGQLIDPQAAAQPVLTQLDLARNRLGAELAKPLVIWLPSYATAQLPFRSPNLWAWLANRFVFKAEGDRALAGASEAGRSDSDASDYNRERARLEELLAETGAAGRADVRAEVLRRLGDVARMQDRYDDADTLLRDALPIYRTISDRLGEANTLLSMGRLSRARGDAEVARDRLDRASAMYREIGNTRWANIARDEALAIALG